MSRGFLWVLLLALLAFAGYQVFLMKKAETSEPLIEVMLSKKGAEVYGATRPPGALTRKALTLAEKILEKPLKTDVCLEKAAGMLAGHLGSTCREIPTWLEEAILHDAGCQSAGVDTVAFCGARWSEESLFEFLPDALRDFSRTTHIGAGRAPAGWLRSAWVVLMMEKSLDIAEFPRRLKTGDTEELKFTLSPGFKNPRVYHMTPDGRVDTLLVLKGDRPDEFLAFIQPEESQRHWVEVMAEGGEGPTVGALFPVYVDIEPPRNIKAPKTPPVKDATIEEAELSLYTLIDFERLRRGLPGLEIDTGLAPIARSWSEAMKKAGRLAHASPESAGPGERAEEAGYASRLLGENLGQGSSIRQAHEAIMASPAHRAALLDPRFTHVGVGVAVVEKGTSRTFYVTEEFSVPKQRLSASELVSRVHQKIEEHRLKLGLSAPVEEGGLSAVAREALRESRASDTKPELGALLRRAGFTGTALFSLGQVSDPDEIAFPPRLSFPGALHYGLAVEPIEGGDSEYLIALVFLL